MYGFELEGGFTFYKVRDFDGTLSLSDGHLKWFWEIMKKGRQIPAIFYDGLVESSEDFIELAKMNDQHMFLGFKDQKPSGLFWLNGFSSRSCYAHFSIMPDFYGEQAAQMGSGVVRHLLAVTDASGLYIFDCIKALIPVKNPLACRMAVKSGFNKIGVIPQAAYWAADDQSVDAAIFCAVRNNGDAH